MRTFCEIILDLENDLSRMKEVSENTPEQMEYAIGQCKVALDSMREHVVKVGFSDQKSEIYFFKKIKPAVYSKLLYYQSVFDLESKLLKADVPVLRRYFQRRLYKMNEYLKELAGNFGINKNLSKHVARYTFTTSITLSNIVPTETISKILGHTFLKTTQVYTRILDSKISKDMNNLHKRLSTKIGTSNNMGRII